MDISIPATVDSRPDLERLITQFDLELYRIPLETIVGSECGIQDIELYDDPDMDGEFISSTHGVRLLWMPNICRGALNSFQSSNWQWTDASDPDDAIRRYREDDLRP